MDLHGFVLLGLVFPDAGPSGNYWRRPDALR
jgi:hypothetical protein